MRGAGVGSVLRTFGQAVGVSAAVPSLSFSGTVATISSGEPDYYNILVYSKKDANQWGTLGTRTGNGVINFGNHPLPNDTYEGRVMSVGSAGVVSDTVDFTINNAVSLQYPDFNWDRWIFASICQHFEDRRSGTSMYVEGSHRRTDMIEDFFELRVDGPWYTELSKDCWSINVEINILCQSAKNNEDFHRLRKMTGKISRAFTKDIRVFKYGNSVWDDQSLVGCLERIDDRRGRERIQTSHFGQIEPKIKLEQATVEAHYIMKLFV